MENQIKQQIILQQKNNQQNPFEITSYDKIQEQLKKQGYCFIELPEELQKSSSIAFNLSKQFFDKQWNNNSPQYQQFFAPPQYGYQKTQYKQSFTILTGNMLEKQDNALQQLIPDQNIQQALKQNAFDFDNFAEGILNYLPEITKNNKFFKEVPLANEKERYGMIDIVQYKNEQEHKVLPHIDPGIIAISVLSDRKGLSFYNNNTNTWVDGPVNQPKIGVIWTGLKTMELNNQFQGGVHQVLPSLGNLRTTMWYEVIIRDQVSQEVQENGMLANKIENIKQQQEELEYYNKLKQQEQQLIQLEQQQLQKINIGMNNNIKNNNIVLKNKNFNKYQTIRNKMNGYKLNHYDEKQIKDKDFIYFIPVYFNNPHPPFAKCTTFLIRCNQNSTLAYLKHQMEEKSGMRYSKIAFKLDMKINGKKLYGDNTKLMDLGLHEKNCKQKITMNTVK